MTKKEERASNIKNVVSFFTKTKASTCTAALARVKNGYRAPCACSSEPSMHGQGMMMAVMTPPCDAAIKNQNTLSFFWSRNGHCYYETRVIVEDFSRIFNCHRPVLRPHDACDDDDNKLQRSDLAIHSQWDPTLSCVHLLATK